MSLKCTVYVSVSTTIVQYVYLLILRTTELHWPEDVKLIFTANVSGCT